MTRRTVLILAGIVVLLVLGPIILLMLAGLNGPRTLDVMLSPAASGRATFEAVPMDPSSEPIAVDDAAWWRLAFDPMNGVPSVDIGTLDRGVTVRVDLRLRVGSLRVAARPLA